MKIIAMAHAAPDLASCLGSHHMSRKKEDFGAGGGSEVQSQEIPGRARVVPQKFVWRLAGRRSSSYSPADDLVDGEMAVGVPVLRACFDPWRRDHPEDDRDGHEGRCQGCSKISKAREVADRLPHVLPRGELLLIFHL